MIFGGADFEGGCVIGHTHSSGNGYGYQQFPDYLIAASIQRGISVIEEALRSPKPPTSSEWQVYFTGYTAPNIVGGIHPPPTTHFVQ